MEEALSYEKLLESIASGIRKLDEVKTVACTEGAELLGRTDTHQADLYWEFTDGELTYKTVIQLRAWQQTATSGELFRFVSLLRDIPGQTTGVLFTQPVYQKDLRKLAQDAGVLLFERSLEAAAARREAVVHNPGIQVDEEWTRREKEKLGLTGETFELSGDPRYLFLYDEENNCIDSVHGIISDYLRRREPEDGERVSISHYFEQPVFLATGDERMPFVRLTGVTFELEYIDPNATLGDEIARDILAHVLGYYSR